MYELIIQKDGRLDVTFPSEERIFDNACPLVLFAGKDKLEGLPVDARLTGRMEVNDRLGQGHGMTFTKKSLRKGCRWYVRAYPTKPFITARVVFVNTGKKPVSVEKLIPWSVGEPRNGALLLGSRAEKTFILENGRLFRTFNDYAEVVRGKSLSQWNLAALNPTTGRSIIAGFLTNERAYTQIHMERSDKAKDNEFDIFRAECVYDPPIEVPPKGQLTSEIFYVSVAEADPLEGLQRYAKAMAVVNGVRGKPPFMPHGWDSWSSHYHKNFNEAEALEELDFVDKHLKRYGWTHFAIDDGWQRGLADWEPDPQKFPHGMKWMADEIHLRGMTAGLWVNPFTVPRDSALAHEHPRWMAEPHALGRTILGDDNLILDVTAPGVYRYVAELCAKFGQEWGFDALMEADFVYHLLLAKEYAQPNVTRLEVIQRGMRALREGFGDDKFIMTVTPQQVNGMIADGIRVGRDCAPVWRGDVGQGPWGCVDTLTNAIRRFYVTPHLFMADQDCAFFGHEPSRQRWEVTDKPQLTWDQGVAWMTGAALTGGVVKIGEPFTELSEREVGVLRRLLPSLERPALPVDVFREESPRIWSLPVEGAAGIWHIVALFNWDERNEKTIPVPFARLRLDPEAYYTVYDFWREKYYGTAQSHLLMEVPAGGVALLGLRAYQDRPMLLASDRHFTQGALDHSVLEWDAGARRLRGLFEAVADTDYTLRVLVPEPYAVQEAAVPACALETKMEGRVLCLSFHCTEGGATDWFVQF